MSFKSACYGILVRIKGTFLHPQWLSDRYHLARRRYLREIVSGRVLDVGSGDASLDSLLSPGCELVRLDYPLTNARYATRPQVFGTALALPFGDASMDVVLLLEVLEHIGEDQRALEEIARVLKPGGALYLSVPFIYPIHDAPHDFRRYTAHGLRHVLEREGFSASEALPSGNTIVAALQMLNLGLLELVLDLSVRHAMLGVLAAAFTYPLCLAINLLALPFLPWRRPARANFGYFVIARREPD